MEFLADYFGETGEAMVMRLRCDTNWNLEPHKAGKNLLPDFGSRSGGESESGSQERKECICVYPLR
jgi:hypothetical protein